jgi:hypothetical protein
MEVNDGECSRFTPSSTHCTNMRWVLTIETRFVLSWPRGVCGHPFSPGPLFGGMWATNHIIISDAHVHASTVLYIECMWGQKKETKVSTSISPFFCASESHASSAIIDLMVHFAPALLIRHQVDMKLIEDMRLRSSLVEGVYLEFYIFIYMTM